MFKRYFLQFLPAVLCVLPALLCMTSFTSVLASPLPVSVLLQINRVAGSASGVSGFSGDTGAALNSLMYQAESVAVDGAGNLYIADTGNNRIRRVDAATGTITTVAGTGLQGYTGNNGPAIQAELNQPAAVLADAQGNIYIADTGNQIIRRLNVITGIISTVAGTPYAMPFDSARLGDGGPALNAELDLPTSIAVDAAGDLYIADSGDNRIREVSQATQIITTVAGNGTAAYGGDNGLATAASLDQPTGVALDDANNIYIADSNNNLIRKVDAITRDIATVAGVPNLPGYNGDGAAGSTELNFPTGIAVDMAGNIYFSDRDNNRIRELNAAGNIATLAGNGTPGLTGDGKVASSAEVNAPGGVTIDPDGDLYFADSGNSDLRSISNGLRFPAAPIATSVPVARTIYLGFNLAGTLSAPSVTAGENNLQEFSAFTVSGCATDGATMNPTGAVCAVPVNFVPGYPGSRTATLQLMANGTHISVGLYGVGLGPETVLVPGVIDTSIPLGSVVAGGIPLTSPGQIAIDAAGNIYVADPGTNQVIRQDVVTAALTIVAGGGSLTPAQADGGAATDARLNGPSAVALDAAANLYIAETGANRVREVNLATGIITTVAGNGTAGYLGDNGPAASAELNGPAGIAANAAGDLFLADTGNNAVRRVYAASRIIATVAGNGTAGLTGNNGFATLAELRAPQGVAVDSADRIFIADTGNNMVRRVDPITGLIAAVAGNGSAGFSGDKGVATSAGLNHPAAVDLDAADNLYVADTGNARVRKVIARSGTIVTVAGSASVGDAGDGQSATAAALSQPSSIALDSIGQIVISDQGNDTVRTVSTDSPILNFGAAAVGATTSARTEFLSNIGNQPLAIMQLSAPTDFPEAQDAMECANGNLAAGSFCDLSFVFHPTVSGPLTEDGSITDNALNATGAEQSVTMTGNGTVAATIATTTAVGVNPTTAIYGSPVVLAATVTGGSGPVNGSVVFFINGIEIEGATLTGAGSAAVTLRAAPTGTDVVTASFAAQNSYAASSSAPVALIVTPANSQITLAASTQQTRLGQNVIFTANVVSTTTGVPTGTVEFLNGSAEVGEALLNATGQAILNTQHLPAGNDAIAAQYLGDTNFQQSISSAVTVTVADDTLTMTANPTLLTIAAGQTGQATVTLTPQNGFAGDVSLSCAGLVQGATCKFSTATLTFNAQTQTAQIVTLIVNPNTVATSGFGLLPGRRYLIAQLLLLLLSIGAAILLYRARKQSVWLMLGRALIAIFCFGVCTLSGCGNLAPQQPVQAAVTVQATMPSSGVIASAQLQVYMQP